MTYSFDIMYRYDSTDRIINILYQDLPGGVPMQP